MNTYGELTQKMFELINEDRRDEAAALLEAHEHDFPDRHFLTLYNITCLRASIGQHDAALAAFQKAIDGGYFYPPAMLHDDDADLQSMNGNPRYEALRATALQRFQEAQAGSTPQLTVLHNPAAPLKGILVALHGNMATLAQSERTWALGQAAVEVVGLAQSSQVAARDSFIWDDRTTSRAEISAHYDSIRQSHPDLPLVLGGFSMGATLATELALAQAVPAVGFVVVGPFYQDVEAMRPHIEKLDPSTFRAFFLLGQADTPAIESTQAMFELLKAHGIACEMDFRPGLAHVYPDDFGDTLAHGLRFVLNG